MKTRLLFLSAVLWLLLAVMLAPLQADIISVNINEAAARRPMASTDLAGVSADGARVDNWNEILSGSSRTLLGADTVYDDGSTVGGSFQVDFTSDRTTHSAVTTLINDPQMYAGTTQVWNGQSLSVDLSGIPFSNYSIYVFTTGGSNSRGGSISLSGGPTYYNRGGSIPDNTGSGYSLITTTSFNPLDPSTVGIGNYVHFTGLTGSSQSFTLSALDMGDSVNQRQTLSGFQIVNVPEASTLGLMSLSLLLLFPVFLRRR